MTTAAATTTISAGTGEAVSQGPPSESGIELSVVMPCLNEADTLAACIGKATGALRLHGISGEIIVADNGSTDGSQQIGAGLGARVVDVAEKGYGNALMGGIAAARGRFVLMGDADDSYDFSEIPAFLQKLREGWELVQGCRLPAGGGKIMPGAMPFLHRWWGNPMFSRLGRGWFGAPIHDIYCGMRGFTRELSQRLDQRCTGMEFATEMIIKSSLYRVRMTEVPITLWPDGRKAHAPHLKTFRDGWRTLRFFLMYSPRWLFVMPGLLLMMLGLLGYALALPGTKIGHVRFDAHTLLFASLAILMGYQAIMIGVFTKKFAESEGRMPADWRLAWLGRFITLERGIVLGAITLAAGLCLLAVAVNQWMRVGFGNLEYARTMRWVIPGATLTAVGFQTILSSFFVSILGMKRK